MAAGRIISQLIVNMRAYVYVCSCVCVCVRVRVRVRVRARARARACAGVRVLPTLPACGCSCPFTGMSVCHLPVAVCLPSCLPVCICAFVWVLSAYLRNLVIC